MNAPDCCTMVPPSHLRGILHQVLPWLDKTIAERGYANWTTEGLVDDLMSGRKVLWAAKQNQHYLFAVTETWMELSGMHVNIVLAGGELDDDYDMIKHLATIEHWARQIGAKSMTVSGRKGWEKLLKPYGYQFEYSVFRHSFSERLN